ncbi:MAG TPA: calcium-binding protein [Thermoleophilaceae bacterium]
MRARSLLLACAVLVACGVAAPAAVANGTLTSPATVVNFTAGDAETNAVIASWSGTSLAITDNGDEIDTAVPGCSGSGTKTVTCTLASIPTQLVVDLKDGDDSANVQGSGFLRVVGGDGSDKLTVLGPPTGGTNVFGDDGAGNLTGDGNDTVTGGPASDQVFGGGGVDTIRGGDGNDGLSPSVGDGELTEGGPGDDSLGFSLTDGTGDTYDGGPGTDELDVNTNELEPPFLRAISVDLLAGTATQTAGGSMSATVKQFETFDGGGSPVTASGTDGPNLLRTFDGDDVLDPRGGPDRVEAYGGADRLRLRDGYADLGLCGTGTDTVEADQFDELYDCENVQVQPVRPAGVDADAPSCKMAGVRGRLRRRAFLHGLVPRLTCSEQAAVLVRLTVPVRLRRGRLVTARAGDLVLAERKLQVGTARVRARLTVPKRLRSVLGRRFKATLTATARDEFGNTGRVTKTVRVR